MTLSSKSLRSRDSLAILRDFAGAFRNTGPQPSLDSLGQMPGVRCAGIWQFLHLRRFAMERLEFGEVVESATRDVVDEGFRRSAVAQDDLVRLLMSEPLWLFLNFRCQ